MGRRDGRHAGGLAVLALLLGACGGGGGGSEPVPAGPVTEISEADLVAAGIPDPDTVRQLFRKRGELVGLAGDYDQDGDVDGADFLTWQNVMPRSGGGGFETDVPPEHADRRIVAWAIYELATLADAHLTWLEAPVVLDGRAPFFFALANASTGGWEIGGRLDDADPALRHWRPDGTRDDAGPAFRRSFSPSRHYVWPEGWSYLLVAVGNPGRGPLDGLTCNVGAWSWEAILPGIEDLFDLGVDGSCAWSGGIGGGIFNEVQRLSYIEQGNLWQMDFRTDHTTGNPRLLFAQPMDLRLGASGLEDVTAHGVVDAADYAVWRDSFFDPGEMNSWMHPFTLHVGESDADDLNVAPLLDLDGAGTVQGIIGILVGLRGPVEGAQVDLITAGDEISITTGKAGVFVLPDPANGSHELVVSWTGADGEPVSLTRTVEVDTEAGTYRFE